jgi:hypothetical protein
MILNYILEQNEFPPMIISKNKKKLYFNALNSCDKKIDLFDFNPENYKKLIKFITKEFINTYYEIFD